MGLTPNFTGNYTVPDDPLVFDPTAPGGVSGHGGDAFDLATVGFARALSCGSPIPNLPIGIPGRRTASTSPDRGAPLPSRPDPAEIDTDGDGLSDDASGSIYHTDPSGPTPTRRHP